MTTRPSNEAIAQAFWEREENDCDATNERAAIYERARDIDAKSCATPDNREVSGLANSEWVMVPKMPTEDMVRAACMSNLHPLAEPSKVEMGHMRKALEAALAAAHTPPLAASCPSCGPDGVYATDGTGPWDCYRCGKKAPTPDVIRDADRWRTFERFLRNGHIPGPGHGRRIKLIEVCPMFGTETEVYDLLSAIDAAIREQRGEKDNG